MITYHTVATKIGLAKIENAALLNQTLSIARVDFGDSGGEEYKPTGGEVALKNKVYTSIPSSVKPASDENSWVEVEVEIPAEDGGWFLREFSVHDDDGNMLFIGNLPESYKPVGVGGAIKDMIFQLVIDVGNASNVQLQVDPSAIRATKKFVEESIAALSEVVSKSASTSQKGLVLLSNALSSDSEETGATSKALSALYGKVKQEERARSLGQPFWHLGEVPPKGALQFQSLILSRAEYGELWKSLGSAERHIKWVTEADKVANKLFGCWSLGDGSTTFGVPDPRGDFLRVLDDGRGVNESQSLGEFAADELKSHTHQQRWSLRAAAGGNTYTTHYTAAFSNGDGAQSTGGNETRPRSIAWMLCFYYE